MTPYEIYKLKTWKPGTSVTNSMAVLSQAERRRARLERVASQMRAKATQRKLATTPPNA